MTTKTSIGELREETEKLITLINDVHFATPYADIELRNRLMKSNSSLVKLLEVLQNYA